MEELLGAFRDTNPAGFQSPFGSDGPWLGTGGYGRGHHDNQPSEIVSDAYAALMNGTAGYYVDQPGVPELYAAVQAAARRLGFPEGDPNGRPDVETWQEWRKDPTNPDVTSRKPDPDSLISVTRKGRGKYDWFAFAGEDADGMQPSASGTATTAKAAQEAADASYARLYERVHPAEPLPPSMVPAGTQAPSQPSVNEGLTSIEDFAAPDSVYTAEEHGPWLLADLPGRDGQGDRVDDKPADFIHADESVAAKVEVQDKITDRMADVPDDLLIDPVTRRNMQSAAFYIGKPTSVGYKVVEVIDPGYRAEAESRLTDGEEILEPDDPRVALVFRRQTVARLVSQWASTSNDHDVVSLALQRAAVDEFGIDGAAAWDSDVDAEVDDEYERRGDLYRAFVRAQYDETQAMFAAQGITELTVYRGMGWLSDSIPEWLDSDAPVSEAEIPLRPMASFSLDPSVAYRFGGHDPAVKAVVTGTIPVSRVMATPRSGVGCLAEFEVVILHGPGEWSVFHDVEQPLTGEEIANTPAGMLKTWDEIRIAYQLAGDDPARKAALIARARSLGFYDQIPASWMDQGGSADVYDGDDPATSLLTDEEMVAAQAVPVDQISTARQLAAAIMGEFLHPTADQSRRDDLRTLADSGRFSIPGLDLSSWE